MQGDFGLNEIYVSENQSVLKKLGVSLNENVSHDLFGMDTGDRIQQNRTLFQRLSALKIDLTSVDPIKIVTEKLEEIDKERAS